MTSGPRHGVDTGRGRIYVAITLVFFFISIACVFLRLWAIKLRQRQVQAHDYLIFAAAIVSVGYTVDALLCATVGGLGMHIQDALANNPPAIPFVLKGFMVSKPLWVTTTTLTKFSILHFLSTIFDKRAFRYTAVVIAVLSAMFWLAYFLEAFLLCSPLAYSWDKTIAGGHCGSAYADTLGPPTVNLILDFFIAVSPMPYLWRLHMPLQKKLLLSGIFSLGYAICAMNIARLTYVSVVDETDFTYVIMLIGLFANLEVYVGITVACLPTFGPLIWREKLSSSHRRYPNLNDEPFRPSKKSKDRTGGFGRLSDDGVPLTNLQKTDSPAFIAVASGSAGKGMQDGPHDDQIEMKTDISVYAKGFSRDSHV